MERCDSLATSFAKCDNKCGCTFPQPCAQDHAFTRFVGKYSSVSDICKSREEGGGAHTGHMLSKHHETQFYQHLQCRPKIVTPIVLYHSYNGEYKKQSSEKACQKLTNCDDNLVNLQPQFSGTIFADTGENCVLKNSPPVTNRTIQKTFMERVLSYKNNEFQDHYSYSDVDSLSNMEQSELTSMKPNLIQNLNSVYYKSAFSKPCPFQKHESYLSNTVKEGATTCVDDFAKVQCNCENSGRDNFQTQCCSLQHSSSDLHHEFKPETFSMTEKNSFGYCGSVFSSSHSDSCLRDKSLVDWGRYLYYSSLMETRQSPMFSQIYGSFYARTYGLSVPVIGSHLADIQSPLSVKQLECRGSCHENYISHFCDSLCTTVFSMQPQSMPHSAEKLHRCECGREFARNEELTRHKRIHSGHRPFHCSVCGKTFGRKDHLNKHRVTHLHTSEKKVHVCVTEGCLQSYTRSDALARHRLSAHGIRAGTSKWRPHL